MTIQTIIEESKKLSKEQKQQLGYYFLFSTLNEDNRNNLMQFFQFNTDLDILQNLSSKDANRKKENSNEIEKETPVFGIFKGMVEYMADDFDAPLDDLKEYMY